MKEVGNGRGLARGRNKGGWVDIEWGGERKKGNLGNISTFWRIFLWACCEGNTGLTRVSIKLCNARN